MWNKCFEKCVGNIVLTGNDDFCFRTPNWDTIIRKNFIKYPDRIVDIFVADGVHIKGTFATIHFLHRNWVEVLGYVFPPFFSADWVDVWLYEVAKMIKRDLFVDIYIEHIHVCAGKAKPDEVFLQKLENGERDEVVKLYESTHEKRVMDANKLSQYILSKN